MKNLLENTIPKYFRLVNTNLLIRVKNITKAVGG